MISRKTALTTLCATLALLTTFSMASAQQDDDRPRDRGPRDGERERRGPRDGDRPFGRGFGGLPNPLAEAIDTDGDGEISATELEGAVAALKTLDKDNNGVINREEMRPDFSRFRGRGRGPGGEEGRFGDRQRPREEADRDRPDGERERAEGDRPEGDRSARGRFGGDQERGPGGRGPGGPEGFVARMMVHDADNDGKLSREELMKAAESFGRSGRGGRFGRGGRGGPGNDRPARPERPE